MKNRELKGLHAPKWKFNYYSHKNLRLIPVILIRRQLLWKDKFATPRIEMEPYIGWDWLWWSVYWHKDEDECEWWLWLHVYSKGDLREALSSWPWRRIKSDEPPELFGVKG